jgi:hypothetical protein
MSGTQSDGEHTTDSQIIKRTVRQIPIYSDKSDLISEEVVMLEFQGEFEHSETTQFDGLSLG